LGLVFTALRLLPSTKSVTQAKRQHVLFGRCLLADIAFQALCIHSNRIVYWRHKVSALCAPFLCHSEPKLATLKFLRRQKKTSTDGGEPKTPWIWAFLAKPFRTAFWGFSKSLCGAKNKESDGLIRKRPGDGDAIQVVCITTTTRIPTTKRWRDRRDCIFGWVHTWLGMRIDWAPSWINGTRAWARVSCPGAIDSHVSLSGFEGCRDNKLPAVPKTTIQLGDCPSLSAPTANPNATKWPSFIFEREWASSSGSPGWVVQIYHTQSMTWLVWLTTWA
jgi:hypothetical protein